LSKLEIHPFICREDNYGVLVHDPKSGKTASIDAPEAAAIERELTARGWTLTHILTTHHHADHVEGNLPLKQKYDCTIIGPAGEAPGIPGMDREMRGGSAYEFAGRTVNVIATPGHTKRHIVLHLPEEKLLFAGDTLFAMGCGRVIEGTMEEMWTSLDTLRLLPKDTVVHCGHEYTEANARFALSVEPGNEALQARAKLVAEKRRRGEMTLPTTIGEELETNPFLRPQSAEIRASVGLPKASDAEVFAATRKRKDNFR
jgi:hydroxyacylglutathione hydrolase